MDPIQRRGFILLDRIRSFSEESVAGFGVGEEDVFRRGGGGVGVGEGFGAAEGGGNVSEGDVGA